MSWADNCLYWQAIFRLMAVQYHCHSLIMAGTTLSDTSIVYVHVGHKHVFAWIPTSCISGQIIVCFCISSVLFLIGGHRGCSSLSQQSQHVDVLHMSFSHTYGTLKLESPIGVHIGAAQLKKRRRTAYLKQER